MRNMQWRFSLLVVLLVTLACKVTQGDWTQGPAALPSRQPATAAVTVQLALPEAGDGAATPAASSAVPTAPAPTGAAGAPLPDTGLPAAPTPAGQVPAGQTPGAPPSGITPATQGPQAPADQPLNPALPATVTAIPSPTLPPTQPVTPNAADMVRQMQVFNELWTAVDENYLYADFNGLDWQAVRQDYTQRIRAGLSMPDFYLAMHQMVRGLGDEHSTYFSPEEAKEQDAEYAGTYDYVGIGVLSGVVEEKKRLVVILVFPGSPADQAGIRMHDSILTADGQPLVDEQGARLSLLRGVEGTSVQVEVQTPGQEPRTLTITRQRVNSILPVPYKVLNSPSGKRIGYIFIPTFNDSTIGTTIGNALREMTANGPLDGLVLDNRENGGGSSTVLEETMSYFINGTAGYFVEHDTRYPLEIHGEDINGSQKVPLVVMVGDGTASFGEIFSGALHDLGRAYLVGEQTNGNVEILNIFNFSDGSRAWIASSTFQPVNDPTANWEATGITPDKAVPISWDEVTLETDPAVQAALAHFDTP